jgi:nucleoside phosphorylase
MALPRLKHEDYIVGWICALPIELTAARATLDENHADLSQLSGDNNAYCLGRIGGHNIVITCLPKGQPGNNAAAKVATRMVATFTSLRFGLIVGIGGGVPSRKHDIRLGDVAVGLPSNLHGGVVQWDLGKTTKGGKFERTGILDRPPPVLLTAISKLESTHHLGESKVSQYLLEMAVTYPKIASKFTRRPSMHDILFDAEYDHIDNTNTNTCDRCDPSRIVSRPRRGEVAVHYGLIASGNQVIKDGVSRDRISQDLGGALCFEMEAAGLMNEFPCIVIRGICDYADSHKNDHWKEYAAATAAAFAKELLNNIPPNQVVSTSTVDPAALEDATDLVNSVTFSSDGRQPASVSGDQSRTVWDFISGRNRTLVRRRSTQEPREVDLVSASSSPATSNHLSSSSDRTSSFETPIAGPNDTSRDRKGSADSYNKKKSYKNARPSYSFSADGRSLLLWARDADNIVLYSVQSANIRVFSAGDVHFAAGGANLYAIISKMGNVIIPLGSHGNLDANSNAVRTSSYPLHERRYTNGFCAS